MWIPNSTTINDDHVSFKNVYKSKINYYLSIHDDSLKDKPLDTDRRTPILQAPYDWNWIESEIRYLTNENNQPQLYTNWYPTVPNYPVEDSKQGHFDRLRILLYGISHMTQDAVYHTAQQKMKLDHTTLQFSNPSSNINVMPWIFFIIDILLLLVIGYSVWIRTHDSTTVAIGIFCLLVLTLVIQKL